MDLKKLMIDSKAVWIDFPGLEGFSVQVASIARKKLTAMRKRCTTSKFNRSLREFQETLDDARFVKEFSKATILNWKGLTLDNLQALVLVNVSEEDLTKELEYSEEHAEVLVNSSAEFDTWLNEVVFDLDIFRSGPEDGDV